MLAGRKRGSTWCHYRMVLGAWFIHDRLKGGRSVSRLGSKVGRECQFGALMKDKRLYGGRKQGQTRIPAVKQLQ